MSKKRSDKVHLPAWRVRRYLNRENAWQNGTRDADLSAVVQELEESVCPEKQL